MAQSQLKIQARHEAAPPIDQETQPPAAGRSRKTAEAVTT
jgi:hypothetical protein